MLTDEERQEWARREWERGQADTKSYWQSMWERSMHNPLNQSKAKDASPMLGDLPDTGPYNPRNTPPPRTAWSKDPWPDARGSLTPPNAPCCGVGAATDKDLSILTEAHGLVHGDRQRAYGHPVVDFARTAALANTLLASKLSSDLEPEDVALFMVAVKLSRECHEPARDNLVDAAGYLECRARVLRFLGNAPASAKDAL